MADDSDPGMTDDFGGDEFTSEVTQPLRFAISVAGTSQPRCNGLFERLADALGSSEDAAAHLMCELLAYVDATPATLTAAQLRNMRPGLFELVHNVLPAAEREKRWARVHYLLVDVAPADRAAGD